MVKMRVRLRWNFASLNKTIAAAIRHAGSLLPLRNGRSESGQHGIRETAMRAILAPVLPPRCQPYRDGRRKPWPQARDGGLTGVEGDAHGDALHDLGEVARAGLKRQQGELRT